MAPTLGYWNIRGLAQPIRLLLAYKEAEFTDKKYNYGPPPEFSRNEWFDVKFTLGLDFPNLPYYIDGDVKLTQSLVILRYLARKHKLDPGSEKERIRADTIEQQITDFRYSFVMMCYKDDFESLKVGYLKNLPDELKKISEFLGKNKWFAGDEITYVDFLVYDTLDQNRFLSADCLKDYQNLNDFVVRFEKLPTIEKYMKSGDFMKWPLNGDMAKFGSRHSKP